MPQGRDWLKFIYVNAGFLAQVLIIYIFTSITQIKQDWQKYRCNPLYMPLSDNLAEDFTYCVQNTQVNFMGYLLQPLTYTTSVLTSIGGEFSKNLDGLRGMFSNVRDFITSIIQNVFGVFLNLITEFQRLTINIKDLVGKIIGIVVTMMYVMDGSSKMVTSMWNGPPGQMVQSLAGGHCFHPNTPIKLANNLIVFMKDVKPGDMLENNNKVIAVMKIDNVEPLMKLGDIYVTGSHLIYHLTKFIKVNDYPGAFNQTKIKSDYYSCLITSDHTIKIGNYVFFDWEDYRSI